jgi:streptogramin lyase
MMMKRFWAAAALIAAGIVTACAGSEIVTPSGASTHTASRAGTGQNVDPQLTPSFVEIDGVPAAYQIASDGAGGEWFGNKPQALVRVDETTHAIQQFSHPLHQLEVLGGGGIDNKMWFASQEDGLIGDIDLQTHFIKVRTVLGRASVGGIVGGPNNSIWFTLPSSSKIGLLEPSTFMIHYYSTAPFNPNRIVLGSDGGLWFTLASSGGIGRMDTLTHSVTEYPFSGIGQDLTSGPDGAIWFGALFNSDGNIGRLDITTHTFTFYNDNLNGAPYGMVTRGSKVWFAQPYRNIGEISPSTGTIHLYKTPKSQTLVDEIALGADDQLWVTETGANRIWEICPTLSPAQCATQSRQFNNRLSHRQPIAGKLEPLSM